ncbi:MAG: sigma factor [Gemmatimonadaceae bacterium]
MASDQTPHELPTELPAAGLSPLARHRFPDTRDSLVQALASVDESSRLNAFDLVVRAYRTPVVVLLSRKWALDSHDAEDIAQEFFACALEKEWLSRYDASRGRFRTFLRTCLTAFASDEYDRARRQKRGGGMLHESLTEMTPLPESERAMDDLFEQEWIRSVLQIALDALKTEAESTNRAAAFGIFERYDVTDRDDNTRPTYAALAHEWDLPTTQVTNYLSWARKRFRQHVLDTVRSLTGSDEEYREEVRTLLGVSVE